MAAGGVHSVILTADGKVLSCGMNEHGTVPVKGLEKEDSTDEFREIDFPKELAKHGKVGFTMPNTKTFLDRPDHYGR